LEAALQPGRPILGHNVRFDALLMALEGERWYRLLLEPDGVPLEDTGLHAQLHNECEPNGSLDALGRRYPAADGRGRRHAGDARGRHRRRRVRSRWGCARLVVADADARAAPRIPSPARLRARAGAPPPSRAETCRMTTRNGPAPAGATPLRRAEEEIMTTNTNGTEQMVQRLHTLQSAAAGVRAVVLATGKPACGTGRRVYDDVSAALELAEDDRQ
jgi:hypothetical protein